MLKLWNWYQNCLAKYPIRTQMVSSGIIWGVGDMAAQTVTHTTAKKRNLNNEEEKEQWHINWKRVAKTSLFGIGFVGPVGHFWYDWLDSFIRLQLKLHPNSLHFIATKVALDVLIFGPMDLLFFFTYMGFSSGKSVSQVKEELMRDFIPAVILEVTLWPFIQIANFRFVPVRYQLLYVNIFCLLDSCFLSWIEQQEEDLPWMEWCRSFLPSDEAEAKSIMLVSVDKTEAEAESRSFLSADEAEEKG
ncbi:protein sym1-like [Salvia miltiorrhiza]|uniref:protein sym1-like n=1 Tax=Salvia miltiorrhiza TaxID=226208 RepID=UPI0025AD9845|nr:protein sym1-like [Salvia miltiorrhiza]